MLLNRRRGMHQAFTLVELLTVIGIISLLISILLPSLSRARAQAKRVKDQAILSALEKGIEMFQNDFNAYPESKERDDPVTDYPDGEEDELFGAHWLARAMVGHDLRGVDTNGFVLVNEYEIKVDPPASGNIKRVPKTVGPGMGMTMADIGPKYRHGNYVEPKLAMRDTDPRIKGGGTFEHTGRLVLTDSDEHPILYYRANTRSRTPFSVHGEGEPLGIYNEWDNGKITGGTNPDGDPEQYWDFANTGLRHGLGYFGGDGTAATLSTINIEQAPPAGTPVYKGKSFANYFHDVQARTIGSAIRPRNPETFLLITSGPDGIFGTDDDVNNMRVSQ
jgi:prepilin-type N-terminal cleavage/methylation domain-containing protein